jgi:hypothetical protein
MLDKIILHKCQAIFRSSPYQFGYKKAPSNMHCSFVDNEVIQHFTSHGSSVYMYIALLDATKAFDRVEYATLFRKLIAKGLCPIITRLLMNCCTQQRLRVRWNNSLSPAFGAANGVKQGGVLYLPCYSLHTLMNFSNDCGTPDQAATSVPYTVDHLLTRMM